MKKLVLFVIKVINYCIYLICRLLPVNDKVIVFWSIDTPADNSYAFYDYLVKNGYMKSYKAVWMVEDVSSYNPDNYENTTFVYRATDKINPKLDYYMAISGFFIFTHGNILTKKKKNKKQLIVMLWHGIPIKSCPELALGKVEPISKPDFILSTGYMATKFLSAFMLEPKDKFVELGYPRNDYLINDNNGIKNNIFNELNIKQFSKVFLWMPTFRQSDVLFSQTYIQNETGLPLVGSYEQLFELNESLKKNNNVLILKVHHAQAELAVFKEKFSNILILKNEDVEKLGVQLYQLLSFADALITDYSSVFFDYLLTDRPILFTTDDYEDYKRTRGFICENALEYMPGPHICTFDELLAELDNLNNGIDKYSDERKRVRELFIKDEKGSASQRLAEYLGLKT